MDDHRQIKAFLDAAEMLRAERYWHYGAQGEQTDFLRALREVLTEVCFHLDAHAVLPQAVLRTWKELPSPGIRGLTVRPSSGLVLISYLDLRIEQLIAESNDSGNTGAEGTHVP
ncbi:UNVERIFIED_ORG: hypothetical protein J2X79_002055 [Arthrobacter globiformis]|nr:hypothetical protein [Arthrobacter globiformis]